MRRVALCVGVNEYDDPTYVNLVHAADDAARVFSLFNGFLHSARFEAIYLSNPTSTEVITKLGELTKGLDGESLFVFYFAGHGLRFPGDTEQSLLCRNASEYLLYGEARDGSIEPRTLKRVSRECRAKKFFCFDTCRSATVVHAMGATPQVGATGVRNAVAFPTSSPGDSGICWALSSTRDGTLARDDGSFAQAFDFVIRESVERNEEVRLGDDFISRVVARMCELGNDTQSSESLGALRRARRR